MAVVKAEFIERLKSSDVEPDDLAALLNIPSDIYKKLMLLVMENFLEISEILEISPWNHKTLNNLFDRKLQKFLFDISESNAIFRDSILTIFEDDITTDVIKKEDQSINFDLKYNLFSNTKDFNSYLSDEAFETDFNTNVRPSLLTTLNASFPSTQEDTITNIESIYTITDEDLKTAIADIYLEIFNPLFVNLNSGNYYKYFISSNNHLSTVNIEQTLIKNMLNWTFPTLCSRDLIYDIIRFAIVEELDLSELQTYALTKFSDINITNTNFINSLNYYLLFLRLAFNEASSSDIENARSYITGKITVFIELLKETYLLASNNLRLTYL